MPYPVTERTAPLRLPARMSYERASVHAILDEAYYCTVAFVVDGEPRALPTLHARIGDVLYLHGSTGSRFGLAARAAPAGLPMCVSVTLLDGLVLARSQFHHSANYRSVVAHGVARLVTDEAERCRALAALVDKVAPGRAADSRAPSARELAQTAVLALQLHEAGAKHRAGDPIDDVDDLALPHWAGVVPLRVVRGEPQPAEDVTGPVPGYLRP